MGMATLIQCDKPEVMQRLYKGELAAAKTYEQALEKLENEHARDRLFQIRIDHINAANAIKRHLELMGAEVPEGSGVWGDVAATAEGLATIFGEAVAVEALRRGETIGVKAYKDALREEKLANECKSLISEELLPMNEGHTTTLGAVRKFIASA